MKTEKKAEKKAPEAEIPDTPGESAEVGRPVGRVPARHCQVGSIHDEAVPVVVGACRDGPGQPRSRLCDCPELEAPRQERFQVAPWNSRCSTPTSSALYQELP